MRKIDVIRKRREARHIENRMKKGKELEKARDIKEVERDISLIRSPAAGLLEQRQKLEAKVVETVEDSDKEDMEAEDVE